MNKKYDTGAERSPDADGERYDLISHIGLRRLAETCHEGAVKYSAANWEAGIPIADMLNHGLRHIYKYLSGDTEEDHLAHAAWNLFGAMHSEEMWPDLNQEYLNIIRVRHRTHPDALEKDREMIEEIFGTDPKYDRKERKGLAALTETEHAPIFVHKTRTPKIEDMRTIYDAGADKEGKD